MYLSLFVLSSLLIQCLDPSSSLLLSRSLFVAMRRYWQSFHCILCCPTIFVSMNELFTKTCPDCLRSIVHNAFKWFLKRPWKNSWSSIISYLFPFYSVGCWIRSCTAELMMQITCPVYLRHVGISTLNKTGCSVQRDSWRT